MTSGHTPELHQAFVVAPPGFESVAADELRTLGIRAPRVTEGGVGARLSREDLYRVNLHSRVASRVIVRLAEFHAESFHELERRAKKVAWHRFLSPQSRVLLRVTCKKSRLYHSDAVAERLAAAISATSSNVSLAAASELETRELETSEVETGEDIDSPDARDEASQLVIVRLQHDTCTISMDSSGEHLHRRGYRLRTAKAPIRENLAAALLGASGWSPDEALVDPFCGAGTFPIEAALIARRIAPGIQRGFQFEHWPDFDVRLWQALREHAHAAEVPAVAPIRGSDHNAGAIRASIENAKRAGVLDVVEVSRSDATEVTPPGAKGWVVSNPPYGVRVGDGDEAAMLARFGSNLRAAFGGWSIALLSASPGLGRLMRLQLEPRLTFLNGGLRVRLLVGRVPVSRA